MIFYPPFSDEAPDKEPNGAYGRKEKCLDSFLTYSESRRDDLAAWIPLVPDLIQLFDDMQVSFPTYLGGKFGRITEVRIFDEARYEKGSKKYRRTPSTSMFFGREMKYEYPLGWLYPVYSAFRVLAGPVADGAIGWKRDPFEFWREHGAEICSRYEPHLKSVGYETKRIGTSAITYSAIRSAVTDLYKDDVLRAAGIVL
jgi:hypothetical protein